MNWINALNRLDSENVALVLITILEVEGSAPRDPGTKMLVTQTQVFDTIGGGNLEYDAIAQARQMLADPVQCRSHQVLRRRYTLGQDLTQCCGGKVELLYELIPANPFSLVLFGAGHVGTALMKILGEMPYRVRWFDSRLDVINNLKQHSDPIATPEHFTNPHQIVESCPHSNGYLVMTHSHETDFELVEAILSRSDTPFCGLIGSKSKAAKFRNRLKRKQFSDLEISRLICPVGLEGLSGKSPMEVATAIAAQLMQLRQQDLSLHQTKAPFSATVGPVKGAKVYPISD